jgi:hypothetical protein
MTKGKYFYCQDEFLRAIEDLSVCAKTDTFGCKYEPLGKVPLHNIVVDELHLMLRITDRMTTNLIDDAADLDDKEKHGILPKQKQPHLDTLIKCINKCGVTFRIWNSKDATGKKTGHHEYTSLIPGRKSYQEPDQNPI